MIGSQRSVDASPRIHSRPECQGLARLLGGQDHARKRRRPTPASCAREGAYTVEMLDFSKGLKSLPTHDFRKFEIDKKSIMPSYQGRLTDSELNDWWPICGRSSGLEDRE